MDLSGILKIFDELPAYGEFIEALNGETAVTPLLLPASARAPVLAKLFQSRQVPILLLTGRVDAASRWMQMLEAWLPEDPNVYRFYEPTPLPYERGPWGDSSRLSRLRVLSRLMAGQHPQMPATETPPLIVSSARAFLQKTMPKRRFLTATRVLKLGSRLDLEKTLSHWLDIGYESVSVVEQPGQFSQRGGIVDVFPPPAPYPVRIELFGDEVDTLRLFDPATQRSMEMPPAMQQIGIVMIRALSPALSQREREPVPSTFGGGLGWGLLFPSGPKPAPQTAANGSEQ